MVRQLLVGLEGRNGYKTWFQPRCQVPGEQAGLERCCTLMVLRGCWGREGCGTKLDEVFSPLSWLKRISGPAGWRQWQMTSLCVKEKPQQQQPWGWKCLCTFIEGEVGELGPVAEPPLCTGSEP